MILNDKAKVLFLFDFGVHPVAQYGLSGIRRIYYSERTLVSMKTLYLVFLEDIIFHLSRSTFSDSNCIYCTIHPLSVNVSCSKNSNPIIWAIDSKGHGNGTFSCLNRVSHEAEKFFRDEMPLAGTEHIAFTHFKDQLLNAKEYSTISCEPESDDSFMAPPEVDVAMSDYDPWY
jgi:hypothetical protein